jgi:hypothetical protein
VWATCIITAQMHISKQKSSHGAHGLHQASTVFYRSTKGFAHMWPELVQRQPHHRQSVGFGYSWRLDVYLELSRERHTWDHIAWVLVKVSQHLYKMTEKETNEYNVNSSSLSDGAISLMQVKRWCGFVLYGAFFLMALAQVRSSLISLTDLFQLPRRAVYCMHSNLQFRIWQ